MAAALLVEMRVNRHPDAIRPQNHHTYPKVYSKIRKQRKIDVGRENTMTRMRRIRKGMSIVWRDTEHMKRGPR